MRLAEARKIAEQAVYSNPTERMIGKVTV